MCRNVLDNAPSDAPWHEWMLMNHEEMYVMYTASEPNNQTCRFSLMDQMIHPTQHPHNTQETFIFHLWFSLAVWKTLGTNQAATTSISSSIPNWVPFGRPLKPLRKTYTTEPPSWLHHWSEVPHLTILSKASSVQALVTAMKHLHNTIHGHELQWALKTW